jgi:signal transduction histidine kinase/predicted RNA-binding protein with RPS1 domain
MQSITNPQWLEVTVERVRPFGVFVILADGRRGYIRRRELDLDADIDPAEVVREGQKIQAVVIKSETPEAHVELSRRAILKDPWSNIRQHYHEGDVVRGTVRALHPNGAFVRIQAGIHGFVPLAEIASWSVEKPDEVLWIGDTVEASVKNIDPNQKRLTLSIRALMVSRDAGRNPAQAAIPSGNTVPLPGLVRPSPPISLALRNELGTVLVVDDHDQMRSSLTSWLLRRGFLAVEAKSLEQAIHQIDRHGSRVLLVDLNLVDKDGLELVRHLRKNGHESLICVMSSMETLNERAEEIQAAQVAQVFAKPLDIEEIEAFLMRLASGESILPWRATPRLTPAGQARTELLPRDPVSIQQHVQGTLEQVTQLVRAETGIIFHLDQASQMVSILALAGKEPIRQEAVYGLGASPVADVIHDGQPILAAHISAGGKARFAKLLELLPFEACIGVPVRVNDEIQHAAFFFHPKPETFSYHRLHDAQAGSLLFAALLTREILEKQLQSLNPMLLSGELARGFGHDVFNKITALDLETRLLIGHDSLAEVQTTSQRLLDLVTDLKATVQAFQQLLQTKETQDRFDVRQVIGRAVDLLRPIAHKNRVKIELNLADTPQPVRGNSILLQQVFLNLMLNAVQQMVLKAENFRWRGQRVLRITTSLTHKTGRVRIRLIDNGPGIHRTHLKNIFVPGFSTRGGSGLGLYIARGFVQSLGGTLRVQETLVPLGTTFIVEVPCYTREVSA